MTLPTPPAPYRVPRDLPPALEYATGRVEHAIPHTGGQLVQLDAGDLFVGVTLRAPRCPSAGAGLVTHLDPADPRRGIVVWEHGVFPEAETPVHTVSLGDVLAVDPVFAASRGPLPCHVARARPPVPPGSPVYRDLLAYLLGDGQAKRRVGRPPSMRLNVNVTHGWPLAMGFWRTAHPWCSGAQLSPPTARQPGGEIAMQSRTLPQLADVIHDAYDFAPVEGRREERQRCRVRPGVLDQVLDGRMLAILIACDGARQQQGLVLCTHGFSPEDVDVLVAVLRHRLDIDCWRRMDSNHASRKRDHAYPVIVIPARAMDRVRALVWPHLHPLYRYKVSPEWQRLTPPWTPPPGRRTGG